MSHLIIIYDDVVFLANIVAECTINNEIKQKMFIFLLSISLKSIVLFIIQINSNEHGTQVKSHKRYLLNKFNKAGSVK